ncbi:hypothetical protein SAVIM40S_03113 [Streptomyces avidinii]|uniref:Secreted protein n=1 Tax=Streptomyces avidinii TaxID=1895 RepID=A0ABS4LFL6_STRAV|nr:hypothetical protein [Streptomyces avidinii]
MRTGKAIVSAAAALALMGSVPVATASSAASVEDAPHLVPTLGINGATLYGVSQRPGGALWDMKVDYNLNFTRFDQTNQFQFQSWCDIWEQDSDDDDLVKRGRHANINAVNQSRTATFSVRSSDIDTELGGEEIYARCFVRNMETGTQPSSYSTRIQISP